MIERIQKFWTEDRVIYCNPFRKKGGFCPYSLHSSACRSKNEQQSLHFQLVRCPSLETTTSKNVSLPYNSFYNVNFKKKKSLSNQEKSMDPSADTKDVSFKPRLRTRFKFHLLHQQSDLGGIIDLADVQSMSKNISSSIDVIGH